MSHDITACGKGWGVREVAVAARAPFARPALDGIANRRARDVVREVLRVQRHAHDRARVHEAPADAPDGA